MSVKLKTKLWLLWQLRRFKKGKTVDKTTLAKLIAKLALDGWHKFAHAKAEANPEIDIWDTVDEWTEKVLAFIDDSGLMAQGEPTDLECAAAETANEIKAVLAKVEG